MKSKNPNAKLVFMTPNYNDKGLQPTSRLEPYVEKMKQVSLERKIKLIDTHALWMQYLVVNSPNYGQREWLSGAKGDFFIYHLKVAKLLQILSFQS